jgi:RNA polymerase sigma-70 factor (ECF subfamily)
LQYSTQSDEQLLEALKHGSEQSFAEIFKRHWKKNYRIAYQKLRKKEISEELVQDLFLTIWEKRATLSINNLGAYLTAAIKHRVISHIRNQIVHKKYWNYYKNTFTETDTTTEKDVEYHELMSTFENGITKLPEKTEQIFILNRLQGKSVTEIARMLNISEKAIEYHITSSLKQLRFHLKDYILLLLIIFY